MSNTNDWLRYLEAKPHKEPYMSIAAAWRQDLQETAKLRNDITACQLERDRLRNGITAVQDGCCGSEDNILCPTCRELVKLLKQEPLSQSGCQASSATEPEKG